MAVKSQVGKDIGADARGIRGYLHKPLSVFRRRGLIAVMSKVEILKLSADREPEMPTFLVSVRAIENLVAGFGTYRSRTKQGNTSRYRQSENLIEDMHDIRSELFHC